MAKTTWNINSIPSLSGKTAIVTGANTGLGYETAKSLARNGVHVVMACRNIDKAEAARSKIMAGGSKISLTVMELDLNKLSSVRDFAERFNKKHDKLDLLINNAGVMMPPASKTKDGFELQWGVNHLGHFLLTALLYPKLEAAGDSRAVHLSSLAHKWGQINFDDLNFEKKYDRGKSYGQSKLACLIFAYEMDRRLKAADSGVKSLAAHPGISDTELSRHLPKWMQVLSPIFSVLIAQSPRAGAQPTLRAALDPDLKGGEYLGPDGFGEYKGKPVIVDSVPKSKNKETARKLWEVSEELTGQKFEISPVAVG